MSDQTRREAIRGAHRAPGEPTPRTDDATSPDLDPEVEQTWLRPRGRNRYPGASWPSESGDRGAADGSAADATDTATRVEPVAGPRAASSAVSRAEPASAELPSLSHASAGQAPGGDTPQTRRGSGRRATTTLDPSAEAAERLAADRATVAAQGEALRRAAEHRRSADAVRLRESDAVRPRPSVEGATEQVVSPQTSPARPARRLIAGGVFDGPLQAAAPAAGPQAESDELVGAGPARGDEPLDAGRQDPAPVRPTPTPTAASPLEDVATRAIAVVRQAGPGPEGTTAATPYVPARTLVMGILNVTLDSFSDGGRYARYDDAIAHARLLAADGADIIDVGGESTRPGAPRVEVHEEQRRVIPVIRELVDLGFRVSIDTMNAATAFAAVEAGADIINDVSGGLADPNMAQIVADTDATYIAMHWRGHSDVMNQRATYGDAVAEVKAELFQRVAELVVQGVHPDRIVIDPGLGFAKLADHNWQLLGHLDELAELGLPILVAASRKRFLGGLLPEEAGVRERDPATAVLSALSARAGAWGVRVHDVASTRAALDVWEAWQKGSRG